MQGWIECIGCADRSAYDLTVHSNRTGEKLVVRESLPEPRVYEKTVLAINKKVFGPRFRQQARTVETYLIGLSEPELEKLKSDIESNGGYVLSLRICL
jgi:glycyl-tRNA synthetase